MADINIPKENFGEKNPFMNFSNKGNNRSKSMKNKRSSSYNGRSNLLDQDEMYIECIQSKNGNHDSVKVDKIIPFDKFFVKKIQKNYEENFFNIKYNIKMPKKYNICKYSPLKLIKLTFNEKNKNKSITTISSSPSSKTSVTLIDSIDSVFENKNEKINLDSAKKKQILNESKQENKSHSAFKHREIFKQNDFKNDDEPYEKLSNYSTILSSSNTTTLSKQTNEEKSKKFDELITIFEEKSRNDSSKIRSNKSSIDSGSYIKYDKSSKKVESKQVSTSTSPNKQTTTSTILSIDKTEKSPAKEEFKNQNQLIKSDEQIDENKQQKKNKKRPADLDLTKTNLIDNNNNLIKQKNISYEIAFSKSFDKENEQKMEFNTDLEKENILKSYDERIFMFYPNHQLSQNKRTSCSEYDQFENSLLYKYVTKNEKKECMKLSICLMRDKDQVNKIYSLNKNENTNTSTKRIDVDRIYNSLYEPSRNEANLNKKENWRFIDDNGEEGQFIDCTVNNIGKVIKGERNFILFNLEMVDDVKNNYDKILFQQIYEYMPIVTDNLDDLFSKIQIKLKDLNDRVMKNISDTNPVDYLYDNILSKKRSNSSFTGTYNEENKDVILGTVKKNDPFKIEWHVFKSYLLRNINEKINQIKSSESDEKLIIALVKARQRAINYELMRYNSSDKFDIYYQSDFELNKNFSTFSEILIDPIKYIQNYNEIQKVTDSLNSSQIQNLVSDTKIISNFDYKLKNDNKKDPRKLSKVLIENINNESYKQLNLDIDTIQEKNPPSGFDHSNNLIVLSSSSNNKSQIEKRCEKLTPTNQLTKDEIEQHEKSAEKKSKTIENILAIKKMFNKK